MPGVFQWSQTAASNASACPTVNWSEGQNPGSINDSARSEMAAVACYRDDTSGMLVTGGTSAAYSITSNQGFDTLANFHNKTIYFTPHITNAAGPVTMTIDGFANLPLRTSPGKELQAGVLIQGTPYGAIYNNTDGSLYLQGFFGQPNSIPLFGGMDFWDTITPGTQFIFPAGQAISRATYATAFARWGTTYGVGDGSTTFNVPDKTGRVSAMKEASATRLTATYFGGNSTVLGATGGLEKETIANGNLPANIPNSAITTLSMSGVVGTGTQSFTLGGSVSVGGNASNNGTASTAVTINAGGANTPLVTVQPTIVCNYIIRII